MKPSAILVLLASLALVSSSTIDAKEKSTSSKHLLTQMMTRIKDMFGDMKQKVYKLNFTPSANPRCMYKMRLCSKPTERPVIADHFRSAMKSVGKWWKGLYKDEDVKSLSINGKEYRMSAKMVKHVNDLLSQMNRLQTISKSHGHQKQTVSYL